MGGRETGGCCDQVCERFFFEVAKFFNSHMTYSNSIKLLPPNILLAEKTTLKVEIPVSRGSFSRLTFQVRRGPCLACSMQHQLSFLNFNFFAIIYYAQVLPNILRNPPFNGEERGL